MLRMNNTCQQKCLHCPTRRRQETRKEEEDRDREIQKSNRICEFQCRAANQIGSNQIKSNWNVKHRSIFGHVGPRPCKGLPLHLLCHQYRHRHWRLHPRRCLVSLNSLLSNIFLSLSFIFMKISFSKICENPNVVIMWLLIGAFT